MNDSISIVPAFLGLGAGLSYALSHFLAKLGLRGSNPISAVLINVVVYTIGAWTLAVTLSPIRPIFSLNAWPFVLTGFFVPSLARILLYHGVTRIGLARSASLLGTVPFFSVSMALVFLGERPSLLILGGALLVTLGIVVLHYSRAEIQRWTTWPLLFPLGAALCFALMSIFTKMGIQRIPLPLAGAAVTATTSLIIFGIYIGFPRVRKQIELSAVSIKYFTGGSFFLLISYISIFYALKIGTVSVVSPLLAINPLFSVLLSYLFLQKEEKVTTKAVTGGFLIVAGALSVILGR